MNIHEIISKLKSIYAALDCKAHYFDCEKQIYLMFEDSKDRNVEISLYKDSKNVIVIYADRKVEEYNLSSEEFIKVELSLKEFDLLIHKKNIREFQKFLNTEITVNTEDIDDNQ